MKVVGNNGQILRIQEVCFQCNPETRRRQQHQSGEIETFSIWYGMVWYDLLWYGVVWYDMVLVGCGMIWLVRYGMV